MDFKKTNIEYEAPVCQECIFDAVNLICSSTNTPLEDGGDISDEFGWK